MISEDEKIEMVRMFCAYCRRTLRNARTDILREEARAARRETLFSDMREAELNRLAAPELLSSHEAVFEVAGLPVVVLGEELAGAIAALPDEEREAVLLYYFAGWTDRRIAEAVGCPRSTVQFRRTKALIALREWLGEEAHLHDFL